MAGYTLEDKKVENALEICLQHRTNERPVNNLRICLLYYVENNEPDKSLYRDRLSDIKNKSFSIALGRAMGKYKPYGVSFDTFQFINNLLTRFIAYHNKEMSSQRATAVDTRSTRFEEPSIGELDIVSKSTSADIRFVEYSTWSKKRRYIFLEDVYIKRNIEAQIKKDIQGINTGYGITIVSGEAGTGKSSLLWNLYNEYLSHSTYYPILIKSSFLIENNPSNLFLELDNNSNRKPLILIDTLDLLLYDTSSRQSVFEFFLTATNHNCVCIATSRPQELTTLYPLLDRGIEYTILKLGHYDEQTELPAAIEKYTTVYFESGSGKDSVELLEKILNIISGNRSLRNLSLNPLTLRMLFSLYAPHEIPNEINIFSLYCDFWDSRVKADNRSGNINSQIARKDLSIAAEKIALSMLSSGKITINVRKSEFLFRTLRITEIDINHLISRGILKRSEEDKLEFFHQTFFEHAAARALLLNLGNNALNELEHRVFLDNSGINFFIYPIYEQVLVLCERGQYSDYCVNSTIQLLNSKNFDKIKVAIYAHCFFEEEYENINYTILQLIKSLNREESLIVKKYLNAASNLSEVRLSNAFVLLQTVWDRNIWNEQYHIIDLLEYYSTKKPDETLLFLRKNNIITTILSIQNKARKKELNPAMQMLVRCIVNLYSFNQKFVTDSCKGMITLHEDKLHFLLFQTLLNNPITKANVQLTESLLELSYSNHTNTLYKDEDYVKQMTLVANKVYLNKWISSGADVRDIIVSIIQEQRRAFIHIKLSALGYYCGHIPKNDWKYIFEYIKYSIAKPKVYEYGYSLLLSVFNSKNKELVSTFLEHFKSLANSFYHVDKDNGGNTTESILLNCYLYVVERSTPYDLTVFDSLSDFFDIKVSDHTPLMQKLLLLLFNKGCEFTRLIVYNRSNNYIQNLEIGIATMIIENSNSSNEALELALRICIAHKSPIILCTLLKRIADGIGLFIDEKTVPDFLKNYEHDLLLLVNESAVEVSRKSKNSSAHLLHCMLRLYLTRSITLKDIERLYGRENYSEILSWVVEQYPYCSYNNLTEYDQLLESSRKYFNHKVENIRNKSEKSFLLLVYFSDWDCNYLLDEILDVYFKGTADHNDVKIRVINRVILKHTDINKEFAFQLFFRLVTSDFLNRLTERKQNEIMHELRSSCIKLCRKVNYDQSTKLINALRTVGCKYGKMIVDGLAFDLDKLQVYMDKLIEIKGMNTTKPCIKAEITSVLQFKTKPFLKFTWPELHQYL